MDQWHPIVKLLHWLMAVLLISMLGIGFAMIWLANQAAHSDDYSARMLGVSIFDAYQLHKSIGVTLFTMLIVRLAVRWVTVPAHHGDLASFERTASKLVQTALYALMLALPLAGWLAGWLDTRCVASFGTAHSRFRSVSPAASGWPQCDRRSVLGVAPLFGRPCLDRAGCNARRSRA